MADGSGSPTEHARAANQHQRDRHRYRDPHPTLDTPQCSHRGTTSHASPPAREGRVRRGRVHGEREDRVGAVEEAGFGGGVRSARVVHAEGVGRLGKGERVRRLGVPELFFSTGGVWIFPSQ